MKFGVKALVSVMALAAAASLSAAGWSLHGIPRDVHWNAIAAFLVLGFVTEASYLKLRVGRTQADSSVSFIPYTASFMLFDSAWAMLVAGGAMLGAEVFVRRKPAVRVIFNVSQMMFAVFVASSVYTSLGGHVGLASFAWKPFPFAAGIIAFFFTNGAAVSLAVATGERRKFSHAWLEITRTAIAYDLFSSPLAALLAFLYVQSQLLGIVILIVPLYIVRHIYQINMQLEQVNRDLLELMVKAIEARDPYTSGHSLRVSQMAEQLARGLGLGHKLVDQIRTAALLHDVGKIHEEYAPLLRKEGKLDPTERALMQTHSARSADLVSTISAFKGTITDSVRSHHENFDGTGYPDGLAGRAIPIGSRIIMIADTIDAMTTDRPYRKALSFERVVQELRKFAGRQFDPELVEVVLKNTSMRQMVESRVESQYLPSTASLPEMAPKSIAVRSSAVRRQKSAT